MAKFIRKRNVLLLVIEKDGKEIDRRVHETLPSISQAKKRSLQLQKAGNVVELDHSADPKPKPLNFPKYGSKRRDAAQRFIDRKEREEREHTIKLRQKKQAPVMSRAELRRLESQS